jgi:pilus assembly protein CpaB
LLTDIKVLAVDQTASTNANDPVIVRAVTLEVNPKQAEQVVNASNEGHIQLTLRNPNEENIAIVEEKPKPAVRRYQSTQSMAIIRGTRVTKVKK